MNLTKFLAKTTKKMAKSAAKDLKSAFKPSKSRSSYVCDDVDPYEEFEKKHGKECARMENKIWNLDEYHHEYHQDPDKVVEVYEKMKELAKSLEEFCKSHGEGGAEFYNINYGDMVDDIQHDLDSFLAEEYDELKADYDEYKADMDAVKAAKRKITSKIKTNDGTMMQKELKKVVDAENRHFERAVNDLIKSGKIIKTKEGSYVRLTLA